ncbi:MAG: hypothetical protein Q4G45_05380 [Actinomycetia bacterium]|nr:hypothetical protein [Actinomycetes bacterium]
MFVGGFGGEAVFEAVILATGALTTCAWARLGWRGAAVTGAVLLAAVGVGNAALWSVPASSAGPALAVQRMTRAGWTCPPPTTTSPT